MSGAQPEGCVVQDIHMFWHGPRLGPVHAACIRSFRRHGHPVVLHCYDAPDDIPEGVTTFDASEIMPHSDLIANTETGSVSLGSNRYRYRMLRSGLGPYVDCDVFCLRPFPEDAYLFGWQDDRGINGAVLGYPPDSALAEALVAGTADHRRAPVYARRRDRLLFEVGRRVGLPRSVADLPWGVWGPNLLTHWVKTLGLEGRAAPIDRYYPLNAWATSLLFEPGLRLADLVTPRSHAIHLWHKMLDRRSPPPGSPLREIIES